MSRVLVVALALLAGCTTIGHERVEGWPELKLIERYVPHAEMRTRCGQYTSAVSSPEACAEFNFAASTCEVWYSADFPPAANVVEHERLHCAGYEHAGESAMRQMLQRWRKR